MNDTYDLRIAEAHIEVHKFWRRHDRRRHHHRLLLQTSVPVYFPKFAVLDLPLSLTIYFGLSRRNPSSRRRFLLLGMRDAPGFGMHCDTAERPDQYPFQACTALPKRLWATSHPPSAQGVLDTEASHCQVLH